MFTVKHRRSPKEFKRLHGIYHGIKKRCYNENSPRFKDYGGRGIIMCNEWLDAEDGFDKFVDWALLNGYNEKMTIERNNVDGDYCPDNCSWISLSDQRKNKRDTLWVEYRGEKIRLQDLCEKVSVVSYDTLHDRIYKRGWDLERALTEPSQAETSFAKKCREHGVKCATVRDRIYKLGWSEERALNTPTLGRGANKASYQDSV